MFFSIHILCVHFIEFEILLKDIAGLIEKDNPAPTAFTFIVALLVTLSIWWKYAEPTLNGTEEESSVISPCI